ncbi:hypothetical protein SADO_01075 [Salinisphaera dokdonensis CL-ES53]|uniref:Uncharacterized protein n=1 Tax=Salinisphaera dokdonensis CL-ES53 TaxID=1304272 RepID=A0ABV2AW29_9GAMM
MARSWLEVTTDEVQSKLGANARLAERRESIAERARGVVNDVVAPAFRAAAEQGDWQYVEDHETEWSVVRCGVHTPGDFDGDPTLGFRLAEFDAYQPLVVLRAKAHGAAAQPTSRIVRVEDIDADTIKRFLDEG